MTFSLAGTVDAAADRLPAALVAPDALDLVRRLAATLPASMTHWVDFECRLAANRPQVDLSLRIDRRGRDRLAGYASAREAMAPPGAAPAWSRVASFAREWSDGATAVHIDVGGMWLEFDLDAALDRPAAPRVFVDFARPARAEAARVGAVTAALAPFVGRPIPPWVRDGLVRLLSVLPPGAELLYAGLPAGERIDLVRLCVRGLDEARAADYLERAGWPGDTAALRHRLSSWRRPEAGEGCTAAAILHVDIDERGGLGSRLGFEYPLRRRPQVKGDIADRPLLDDLVACGACTPAKRGALLEWPGCEVAVLPHEMWPSVVMRRVSHVKIVCDGDAPIEAKAYCCFSHEWRPLLAGVDRHPTLSSRPTIAP